MTKITSVNEACKILALLPMPSAVGVESRELKMWHCLLSRSRVFAVCSFMLAVLQFVVYVSHFGPLTAPDPEMSVAGSYALATGQSFNSTEKGEQEIAGNIASSHLQKIKIPENLIFDEGVYHKGEVTNLLTSQIVQAPGTFTIPSDDKLTLQQDRLIDKQSSSILQEAYTRANQYMPISYISMAAGMKVAMLFVQSSWGLLLGARISNFVVYLLLASIAVALAPRAKGLFAVIACLPPAVFCAASMSTDALLIGVSLLYVSWAFRLINREHQLCVAEMVGIGFLTLLLLLLKPPYAPLALLYLAIPKNIWSAKAKLITGAAVLLVFLVVYLVWSNNYQMVYIIPSLNYPQQVVSVLGNLPKSLLVCFVNAIFYIGITGLTSLLYMIVPVAIAVALCYRGSSPADGFRVGLVVIIIMATVTLIYFFLMLTWNYLTGGIQNLSGFQERYLLPLMPVLAFLCSCGKEDTPAESF